MTKQVQKNQARASWIMAFEQGEAAFAAGKPAIANPYNADRSYALWFKWNEGFAFAAAEAAQ